MIKLASYVIFNVSEYSECATIRHIISFNLIEGSD